MLNIIGKTYQRIGSSTGDTFTVDKLEGEFVIFKNGARLKLTSLLADFSPLNGELINENNSIMDINPETFFTTPTNTAAIDQLEQLSKNPHTVLESNRLKDSIDLNINNNTTPFSNEKQINTPSNFEQRIQNTNLEQMENNVKNNSQRVPEWDIFDRVKKTEDIELNVILKIKLPKARHIESINDMYETSFSSYLAKQYINDTVNLQLQIKNAIEEWINSELDTPTKSKRKTIKSKKIATKKINSHAQVSKTKIKTNDEIFELKTKTSTEDSAISFFNSGNSIWDGNVDKLIMINTSEQYNIIKQRLTNMTEDHKDYYRFEDMIAIYEDLLKSNNTETSL